MFMPMGGGGGGVPLVVPSQQAKKKAGWLKIVLIIHLLVCISSFVFDPLGALFELLAVGFAWYGIKDADVHKPSMISAYSMFCGMFFVFQLVYLIVLLSDSSQATSAVAIPWSALVSIRAVHCLFYLIAARLSWVLFLDLYSCAPASLADSASGLSYGSSPYGGNPYAATYAQPSAPTSNSAPPARAGGNSGFQPFQGSGFKLGSDGRV